MKKFYERKKAFFVVFFLVVILIIFSASLAYSADEWTIMVYIDGDNDLEDAAWDDLEEMETVGSISGVNVVVQLDDWQNDTETWRYLISGADMGADKPYYSDDIVQFLSEQNMADPVVLKDFINWAISNYPAQKYMLVLWNHGDGWRKRLPSSPRGVIWDDTSDDFLTMAELLQALNGVNQKINIVSFDACLMGMVEVAYTLSRLNSPPDYMVGSEEVEPGNGWPYDDILNELKTNPTMEPLNLASLIPGKYTASYPSDQGVTQAAIDIGKIDDLSQKIDDLANAISNSANSSEILDAFQTAQSYYGHSDYLDLYNLCEIIYQNVPDCEVEASAVISYISEVIVAESHSPQGGVENSHGISIYGELPPEDNYDNLDFAADTTWDEALVDLATGTPPQNVVAGDGFNGMVPLTWDPFENQEPDYYRVYRSQLSGGPYELIASVDTASRNYSDNEDYVDENVINGFTYYYIIKGVISGQESDPSKQVSATPSARGKVLYSGYTSSPPTIDGKINSEEWKNATKVDIALYKGGVEYPIYMRVMNDDNYLYIALDDENLTTEEEWNDFYIFFDDDNNGEWPASSSTTEGYFDVQFWSAEEVYVYFYGIYGTYPDDINELWGIEATGVTVGCSFASGHLQYEIAIDLSNSYLTANPGDSIGFWVCNWDDPIQGTYYYTPYDGAWPVGSVRVDPKTYAKLILSTGQEKFTLTGTGSYPNPVYSGNSVIRFELGEEATIDVKIYTVSGELVRNLVENSTYPRGLNEVIWDMKNNSGERIARGVYIYVIRATSGGKTLTKTGKIAVIK
ncbi:T9SS type A sorting domain-containing protein [Candidatus Aerophobetes bacterium]|nr:T9SS type A sorting domain-containing protein [Candidatus Aerophobetes bacterium]